MQQQWPSKLLRRGPPGPELCSKAALRQPQVLPPGWKGLCAGTTAPPAAETTAAARHALRWPSPAPPAMAYCQSKSGKITQTNNTDNVGVGRLTGQPLSNCLSTQSKNSTNCDVPAEKCAAGRGCASQGCCRWDVMAWATSAARLATQAAPKSIALAYSCRGITLLFRSPSAPQTIT